MRTNSSTAVNEPVYETKTLVLKMPKRSLGGLGGMPILLAVTVFFHTTKALGQSNELQVRVLT